MLASLLPATWLVLLVTRAFLSWMYAKPRPGIAAPGHTLA
ncbi:hypothetical protein CA13_50540 [Planctomycetes bacterium CA13]|uniref:Uncharacterized protein n=1 Tax=Novipirellula herctigrandis TaxID=2527986 RepID=A0A5C5Z919_9BACT|nr:hypothetical protein CA13_50540 [Planctomycetes bacterium CA13]